MRRRGAAWAAVPFLPVAVPGGSPPPQEAGLAPKYPGDAGIERDPAVAAPASPSCGSTPGSRRGSTTRPTPPATTSSPAAGSCPSRRGWATRGTSAGTSSRGPRSSPNSPGRRDGETLRRERIGIGLYLASNALRGNKKGYDGVVAATSYAGPRVPGKKIPGRAGAPGSARGFRGGRPGPRMPRSSAAAGGACPGCTGRTG